MEGILLINKPAGPSSFDVIRKVRKVSGIKKVGHAGTLDPLASGLMIVCLGRYTKLASILTPSTKCYRAVFKLGATTTTDDAEGEIIAEKSISLVTKEDVYKALANFTGPIKQRPPQFSAIKIKGQRAYALARAQKKVDLPLRDVLIYQMNIEECSLPFVHVFVECSKGTYIRSLARDLGEYLGEGAFAQSIHRVSVGGFSEQSAIHLDDLNEENISSALLSGIKSIPGIATVEISEQEKIDLKCGRKLSIMPHIPSDQAVAVYENDLVALFSKQSGRVVMSRVL